MKTILVPTDFSPASLNAAKYAADMAAMINADLFLLHMYFLPVSYSDVPVAMSLGDMENLAEKDMKEFKTQLLSKRSDSLNVKTRVRLGNFFSELEIICERVKPYAVVMGSQGTTAAERFLFGSHAVYAMKHLKWPLITVPPGVRFSSVKKIGFACDFDKVVDTIPIDEIKKLVNDFNAELYVLNIGKEKVFDPNIVFESGLLQEMLEDLSPQYRFIANENMDEGLITFAEKNQIDLLVVLPKRHSLVDKLLHKSHTKQLVLHSHVPVMALHQCSS